MCKILFYMGVFVSLYIFSWYPVSEERGNKSPFMCRDKQRPTINVSLKKRRLGKNVTFDSADWIWLLYNQWTCMDLCAPAHARAHTPLAVQYPLCVCVSLPNICFTLRPSYTRACMQNHNLQVGPFGNALSGECSFSHDDTLVVVIHHRKFRLVCGTNEFYVGEG